MLRGHAAAAADESAQVCDVESDKAAVEITSRYDGIVRKLQYKVARRARTVPSSRGTR